MQQQQAIWPNNFSGLCGNFKHSLRNHTSREYYGALIDGTEFTLSQEPDVQTMMAMYGNNFSDTQLFNCGIIVQGEAIEGIGNFVPRNIGNKFYNPPMPNRPVYIPEVNVVLFYSIEERERARSIYGSLTDCVKSYGCGITNFFNASYIAFTPLNEDTDFCVLLNGSVVKVPKATPDQVDYLIKKNGFDPATLDTNYVIMLTNCIRSNAVSENTINETIKQYDVKVIPKAGLIKGEPLIQEASGLTIFDSKESADAFVAKYGTVAQYMASIALKVTHKQYEEDLKDVNEQAAKDKNSMFNTFLFMGGTSLAAVLSESLLKTVNETEDTNVMIKKVLKIVGVGTFTVLFGLGLYKTFKYFKIFNKKIKDKLEKE